MLKIGLMEFAGVDKTARSKMGVWKMQEKKNKNVKSGKNKKRKKLKSIIQSTGTSLSGPRFRYRFNIDEKSS